jgi:hypothetical protein
MSAPEGYNEDSASNDSPHQASRGTPVSTCPAGTGSIACSAHLAVLRRTTLSLIVSVTRITLVS